MISNSLATRYRETLEKIKEASKRSSRPLRVTLLAVSKFQPVEAIQELYQLGHRDFGENYVQELVEKARKLDEMGCKEIRWHFIGHLQTNKVKILLPFVYAIHSVDSEKLASEISKRWQQLHGRSAKPLEVFLEVNIDQELNKAGVSPEVVCKTAELISASEGLSLQGLMAIPSSSSETPQIIQSFKKLKELELKCRPYTSGQLSMGMSNDFELAIQEGATHVRVGTALFGPRTQT